jgi:hypothetical protein
LSIAGKGRTGLLITVFLLYCGEWATASEALRYYAFVRTQNQKGVTIASQIRYCYYFEKYLTLSRDGLCLPKPRRLMLNKMIFSSKSPSFDWFMSSCHGEMISSKDKNMVKRIDNKDGSYILELDEKFNFITDFQFEFFDKKLFG